jgi:hypothetical protein
MTVVADIDDEVREGNESNNERGVAVRITGDDPMECVDDRFEPNDSIATAIELIPDDYDGLVICDNDPGDFFRFCPDRGSELEITLRFDERRGDIDVVLTNSDGEAVDSSQGLEGVERVRVDETDGGCYVVEIFLFAPERGTEYRMEVDVEEPVRPMECTEALEPNNTFDQAGPLSAAQDEPLLDFCPRGDADFYTVELEAEDVFVVSVAPLGDQPPGDIIVAMYGPDLDFIAQAFDDAPTLQVVAPSSGTYRLRLGTSSGAEVFQYSVESEIR